MARGDLRINAQLIVPASEIEERFSPAGGPGGQHANRAHTRVELRFDIGESETLTDQQRARLIRRFGGDVRVVADERRSQMRNREVARERLASKLRDGLHVAKRRRPTRPSRGASERRLAEKRERSEVKRFRQRPSGKDDF